MKKFVSICLFLALVLILGGCSKNNNQLPQDDADWENVQVEFNAGDYYSRLERCVNQIREKTDFYRILRWC